jgi:hypothetical protein
MAVTVMVLGMSGDGKSSSMIVPPSGVFPKTSDGQIDIIAYKQAYMGMDPKTTVIVNCDGKSLPFPSKMFGWEENVNLFSSTYNKPITADYLLGDPTRKIPGLLDKVDGGTGAIKALIIDTMNGSMNDKEMLESRNLSWDKWYDLAKDYYAICVKANSLRPDLIIYLFGHVALQTNVEGTEEKALLTNGKKLEKIQLQTKVPVVLTTNVIGLGGENEFVFETRKNKSIAKTPMGMFKDFKIPNSLRLVDDTIRKYYSI